MSVRTRFAPSPTGFLHVGGARTALYSWLYARHNQGQFILRIEDTDVEREKEGAVDAILASMKWLGMYWDEGPYYQTRRLERYNEVVDQLLMSGQAYRCYCSKARLDSLKAQQEKNKENFIYDRHCLNHPESDTSKPHVVRLKSPQGGIVAWNDMIRGRIEFNNSEFDDFIIRRTDGWPTYNFCVVVDDIDMKMTHIIRAEEHINNTPKQIYVYRALGLEPPIFAHVSPILGDDGKKLSKRHGAVSVMQYQEDGFLPEALRNYLVRLGWGYQDQEIFSLAEMISLFDINNVSNSPSAFNTEKLLWLNKHYIAESSVEDLLPVLQWHLERLVIRTDDGPALEKVIALLKTRVKTMKEMAEACRSYYGEYECLNPEVFEWLFNAANPAVFRTLYQSFSAINDWQGADINRAIGEVSREYSISLKDINMPLRLFILGVKETPSLNDCLAVLGKEKTLARLYAIIDKMPDQ